MIYVWTNVHLALSSVSTLGDLLCLNNGFHMVVLLSISQDLESIGQTVNNICLYTFNNKSRNLSIYLSIYLSISLYIYIFIYIYIYIYIYAIESWCLRVIIPLLMRCLKYCSNFYTSTPAS